MGKIGFAGKMRKIKTISFILRILPAQPILFIL